MAGSNPGMVIKVAADITAAQAAFADVNTAAQTTGTQIEGITPSVVAVGTAIGTFAADAIMQLGALAIDGIGQLATAFGELVMEGADVSDISSNFDTLAASTGQVAATMLGTLREGTHGTINDFELMKIANTQMAAGLTLSEEQMGTLAKGAFDLAQATGTDVKDGLEKMSQAMVTGKTKSVELLTGKLDLESAERRYALSLGKTRDQLTEDQTLYARQQALLAGVADGIARVGDQTDGIGEKVEQARAQWDNFRQGLAQSIAESPVLTAGLEAIQTALMHAFGGDQASLIETITKAINQGAIYAVDFAINVVELARSGIEAFGTLKTPIDWITIGITELVSKTASGIATMLELAAAAPGVGSAFETQAASARAAATEYGALNDRAHEQLATDRALATGQGAVHDALTVTVGVLGDTKAAMVQASLATTAHTTATTDTAAATRAAADAAATDAEALRKQEEALKAATAAQKKMDEALRELASVGASWVDTLMAMDGGVADMARAYLDAGAKAGAVQTALHLTDGEMKAITESMKAQEKTLGDLAKMQEEWAKTQEKAVLGAQALWAEYDKIRDAQTKTATDQQIAEIERWKQAQIAAHEKDLTLTQDVYDAIEATAGAKLDAIRVDWSALTTASTTSMQQTADKARATYEEALTGSHNLTSVQIDNFRRTAEQAQIAADQYANAFVGAADTVTAATTAAADHSIAANSRVAQSAKTALDQITGVYSFGQLAKPTKPAGMSESEWALMQSNPRAWEMQHGYDWAATNAGTQSAWSMGGGGTTTTTGGTTVNQSVTVNTVAGDKQAIANVVKDALASDWRSSGVKA